MIKHIINHTTAQENLTGIMTEICDDNAVICITGENGNNCVLMSEKEYNSIMEMLYLFDNPANALYLENSLTQAKRGEFIEADL